MLKVGNKKIALLSGNGSSQSLSTSDISVGLDTNLVIDTIAVYWHKSPVKYLTNILKNQTLEIYENPSGTCGTCTNVTTVYNTINIANQVIEKITVTDTLKISRITGFNTLPQDFGIIKIFPNPTKDILNISVSQPNIDYQIKITDNVGKVLLTNTLNASSLQVNLSQFTARGLYLIHILNKENQILDVRKLVLE